LISVLNRISVADLDLLAVGQLDGAVDPDALDPGSVEAEVAEVPVALLEVDLGVEAAGQFIPDNDGVVAAAAEGDRLPGE